MGGDATMPAAHAGHHHNPQNSPGSGHHGQRACPCALSGHAGTLTSLLATAFSVATVCLPAASEVHPEFGVVPPAPPYRLPFAIGPPASV
jgi:hypothetical protein